MHSRYVEGLEKCLVPKDVEKLFRNAKLDNISKTPFFDESIFLMRNGRLIRPAHVKVDGILGLAFRVFLFLKFGGFLGTTPVGAGERGYFDSLQSILMSMSQIRKITRMDDIDGDLLDRFIELERDNGKKAETIARKIVLLFEYLTYPEVEIPSFLLPDENAMFSSKLLAEVNEERRLAYGDRPLVASEKKVYPLDQLKTIMQHSIDVVENYAEEILLVASAAYKTQRLLSGKRYSSDFDIFNDPDMGFAHPILRSLQEDARGAGAKFNHKGRGQSVRMMRKRMLHAINDFEVSCVSVALMTTGMRGGELMVLDRKLKISKDEHWHLERLVYKTAKDEKGEPLTMPIPTVCKKALEGLSRIATIKDGKSSGNLVLSSVFSSEISEIGVDRLNSMLESHCDKLGVERITSHQFRHAMAFLIVRVNEKNGLDLARMFLGHTSVTMTLQYMGQYNRELREALEELGEEESAEMVDKICDEISGGRRLFGAAGKMLAPNHVFTGQQAESYVKLLKKAILQKVKEKKILILQTPTNLCFHDFSNQETHSCQRGFDLTEIASNGVMPARCTGASCNSSVFFEEHIEQLKDDLYQDIEPSLRERLEQNTFFVEAGGFEQDPFSRLVKQYDEYKCKKEELRNG